MQRRRPNEIIKKLRSHGHEAFFVGGCVRDTLLGRDIHDWDITTSALPEQVIACFDDCVPTGIRHGTVTVRYGGAEAEVTTYRADGIYMDGRHPENVTFVKELSEDLARRDFTVNAMAMDEKGCVTDLFGGIYDLEHKCIRCIGEPDTRFQEDALRMLRAVRFAAQLGFRVEEKTEAAIKHNAHLCRNLSMERVRDEVEKTLCSSHPERLDDMAAFGLLQSCCPSLDKSCAWLAGLSSEPVVRWSGLCATWEKLDISILRLDKRTARMAVLAGKCAVPHSRTEWKRLSAEHGEECFRVVAALSGKTSEAEEILRSGECMSLRQLAVDGTDFPGLTGPEIGSRLRKLLLHVLEHPEDNRREVLIDL